MNSFEREGLSESVELIVREGTDQGQRKAGKIARAYVPGTQRIIAELLFPRLVGIRPEAMVITGIERNVDSHNQPVGFAQSWICQIAPPLNSCVLYVGEMFFYGQPVPRGRMRDKHGGCYAGQIWLESEMVPQLRRLSQIVTFRPDSGGQPKRLLDAELRWMGEESFALAGTHLVAATREKPELAYEGGWLCSYFPPVHVEDSKKSKAELLR